jgi:hypothetical protein
MSKQRYVLVIALLLATLALAACGGGDSAATPEAGAAENVPATDAAAAEAAATEAADTASATEESSTGEVQQEPASTGSETTGAGDASGANAAGDAASATDVGSGSDGAAGSGGSDGAGGTTAPNSDTGAPVEDSTTTSAESGTGGTGDTGAEGGTASGAGTYTAVSDAECTEIQGQLSTALGVEVNRTTGVASFADLSGGTGESCQLTVSGTGAQFTNMVDTAALIRQTLSDNGWTVDEQYAADGPTGTMGGLRRDNQLAAYNVQWQPAAGVECPTDQPISACAETLTPEQMDYTITVDLAQQ